MNRLVVDASALAAFVFQEPEGKAIAARLNGASLFAPTLLTFELASVARMKMHAEPALASRILMALATALEERWGIVWCDVDPTEIVLVANASSLTTYDAAYLWLAGSLGADLVTLDARLASAGTPLAE